MSEPSSRKRSIGSITFAHENSDGGWTLASIMGAERIRLLKLAVAGELLPAGLILVGQTDGGYERITREAFREDDVEYYGLRS